MAVILCSMIEIVLIELQEFVVFNVKLKLFVLSTQTAVLIAIVFTFIRYFFIMIDQRYLVRR